MRVRTYSGYEFECDDPDVKLGKQVVIPIPEVETEEVKDVKALKFLAQMYGRGKKWNQNALGPEYQVPEEMDRFPDYIFKLPEHQLVLFLTQLLSSGGSLVKHYSTSSEQHTPEVWFRLKQERLCHELQYLWWRLGVKTRPVNHTQVGWMLQTTGQDAYVRIRPYIIKTYNPKLTKKTKDLDVLIPFKFRTQEPELKDKVVEIIDG